MVSHYLHKSMRRRHAVVSGVATETPGCCGRRGSIRTLQRSVSGVPHLAKMLSMKPALLIATWLLLICATLTSADATAPAAAAKTVDWHTSWSDSAFSQAAREHKF